QREGAARGRKPILGPLPEAIRQPASPRRCRHREEKIARRSVINESTSTNTCRDPPGTSCRRSSHARRDEHRLHPGGRSRLHGCRRLQPEDKVTTLHEKLIAWRKEVGALMPTPNSA